MVDVVKESLDVHCEEGGGVTSVEGMFDIMSQGQSSVHAGRRHDSSELFWGHERMFGAVEHKSTCDRLLYEFA